jgi:hypothetical protein
LFFTASSGVLFGTSALGGDSRDTTVGQDATGRAETEVPLYQFHIWHISSYPETSAEAENRLYRHYKPFCVIDWLISDLLIDEAQNGVFSN